MDFKELVIKFLAGEITENELSVLKSMLEDDADCRRVFNQENELWQSTNVQARSECFKTDEAWNNIASKLGIEKGISNSISVIGKRRFHTLLAAASIACLLGLSGITLWLSGKIDKDVKPVIAASTMITTDEGEKAHIYLPDSTQVFINSGSSLKYKTDYNTDRRVVALSGEAFFDVSTNPGKPFIVQLDKMTVTATGTRFNILSYGNEDRIETTLEEGKIKVAVMDQKDIDVKSGQQVVYFTKTNKTIVRDVATETYTSWKENKLRLIDTPFEEALRRIGRRYNVTFEIRNKDLLDLKYTATFIDESIDDVMHLLQNVSPISYEIKNRTAINDKKYVKPKIIVRKRKY